MANKTRYQQALELAAEVLEEEAAAVAWLKTPAVRLGGAIPKDLLNTDDGLRQVLDVLKAIDHGLPV